MAEVKIPKPDNDTLQTWLKGTRDKKLVYSTATRKWKIVPAGEVADEDVTYENYQQGKTTFTKKEYEGKGDSANRAQLETVAQYEAGANPLKAEIEKYGLKVYTDPQRDGVTYLADDKNNPFYVYFTSDGTLKGDTNYDVVKAAAINDLKKTGQLNSFFEELYKRKVISKEVYERKDIGSDQFNSALAQLISEYSKSVFILNEPLKDPQNFFDFVKGIIPTAGADERDLPRREFQDISKEALNAFIESIYLETIGRKPTEEQRSAKLKELNKIVKRGIVTTTTVEGGELVTRRKGGFDEQKQSLKLQEQLKQENPLEYERRQAFDFMDELQKIMSGGI